MHILNALIWLLGTITFLVILMWTVSHITAFLLTAYLNWKDRRKTEGNVTISDAP